MPDPTRVLLWTDTPTAYLDAIAAANLTGRVAVEAVSRTETPTQAQRADTEALLAWGAPAGLLPQMPKLRWVPGADRRRRGVARAARPAAGPDGDLRARHPPRVMAENILGALFHLTKPYAASWRIRRAASGCGAPAPRSPVPHSASSASVRSASRWRGWPALGMRVIGTKRRTETLPDVAEVLPTERTDEVLAQSDYVLLLLPATPDTENFMNAQRLAKMKPTAWLLNFGRGHLIADADLIAAVKEKRIAGAVLDVFRQEPLPAEHPFWTTERIVVLPHIGGGHPQRDTVVAQLFVENLGRFLDGKPLKEVVDRAAGY